MLYIKLESSNQWVPQSSVLGPVLFKKIINDLDDGIDGFLVKFVDDTKLGGLTGIHDDRMRLQSDFEAIYTIEMRCFILVLKTHFWFTFPVLSRYLLYFRSLYWVLSHILKTVLEAVWAPSLHSFFNWFYFQTWWSAQRGVAEPVTKGTGGGK